MDELEQKNQRNALDPKASVETAPVGCGVPEVTEATKKEDLSRVAHLTPTSGSIAACVNCRPTSEADKAKTIDKKIFEADPQAQKEKIVLTPLKEGQKKRARRERQKAWLKYSWLIVAAVLVVTALLSSYYWVNLLPGRQGGKQSATEKQPLSLSELVSRLNYTLMYTLDGNVDLTNVSVRKGAGAWEIVSPTIGEELMYRGGMVYVVNHARRTIQLDQVRSATDMALFLPIPERDLGTLEATGNETFLGALYRRETYSSGIKAYFTGDDLNYVTYPDGRVYQIWAFSTAVPEGTGEWPTHYEFVSSGQPDATTEGEVRLEVLSVEGDKIENTEGEFVLPGSIQIYDN